MLYNTCPVLYGKGGCVNTGKLALMNLIIPETHMWQAQQDPAHLLAYLMPALTENVSPISTQAVGTIRLTATPGGGGSKSSGQGCCNGTGLQKPVQALSVSEIAWLPAALTCAGTCQHDKFQQLQSSL